MNTSINVRSFVIKWGAVVVAVLALLLVIKYDKCTTQKQEVISIKTIDSFYKAPLDSNSIKRWIDKYNNEHAIVLKMVAVNNTKSEYVDSLAVLLSIANKQIQSISVIKSKNQIDESLRTGIDYTDVKIKDTVIKAVNKIHFNWSDDWTEVSGVVGVESKGDSIHITSIDTLTGIDYWKRKKILGLRIGSKVGYVDYSNANPHVKIVGGKKLDLHPPKQNYSIGLSAGLGYNPFNADFNINKPRFSIGLSISRNLIKF